MRKQLFPQGGAEDSPVNIRTITSQSIAHYNPHPLSTSRPDCP